MKFIAKRRVKKILPSGRTVFTRPGDIVEVDDPKDIKDLKQDIRYDKVPVPKTKKVEDINEDKKDSNKGRTGKNNK
jgi:DNA-binding transcriptional regulator of glucitol operon